MVKDGYIRDIDVKYLISGPAPLGRILNYIKRIKLKQYTTVIRGPQDALNNLDDWTTCFMVGLGLINEYNGPEDINLTQDGEIIYNLIYELPDFPDNLRKVKDDLFFIKQDIRLKHSELYNTLKEIFLKSRVIKNLAIFFRKENIKEINRQNFYNIFGKNFSIEKAGFNRLPSLIQIAEFCDILVEDSKIIKIYDDKYIYGGEITKETNKDVAKDIMRKDLMKKEDFKKIDNLDEEILEDLSNSILPEKHESLLSLFLRNKKIIIKLKELYKGKCQICGFTFEKNNGENYSEAHHVIPLGDKGSDEISNLIIVCANCHSQLHYDKPELKEFDGNKRKIKLNGEDKVIIYKKEHLKKLKLD